MIRKISIDRMLVFSPSMQIILRAEIKGCKNILSIKKAIMYAVQKFEILNSRVLQDEEGECYYVTKENFTMPHIEIRNYIQSAQEFVNEQEKIQFNFEGGELIRFIVSVHNNKIILSIVQHHLAGDGKSALLFLQEIMENLEKVDNGEIISMSRDEMVPIQMYTKKYLSQFVEVGELEKIFLEEVNNEWRKSNPKIFRFQDLHELFESYWKCHRSKVATATISEHVVKQFSAMCKKNKVTVNNAIITSILKDLERKQKISIIVDLRTEDFKKPGNYAGGFLIEVQYNPKIGFWENAKNVQKLVSDYLNDRTKLMLAFLLNECMDKSFIDGTNFQYAGRIENNILKEYNSLRLLKEEYPLIVSNLGINQIKERYGKFKIEGLSFFSPVTVGFSTNVSIITENGKMVINVQSIDCDIEYQKVLDELVRQMKSYYIMNESC